MTEQPSPEIAERLVGQVARDRIRRTAVPRHEPGLVERLIAISDMTSAVADPARPTG